MPIALEDIFVRTQWQRASGVRKDSTVIATVRRAVSPACMENMDSTLAIHFDLPPCAIPVQGDDTRKKLLTPARLSRLAKIVLSVTKIIILVPLLVTSAKKGHTKMNRDILSQRASRALLVNTIGSVVLLLQANVVIVSKANIQKQLRAARAKIVMSGLTIQTWEVWRSKIVCCVRLDSLLSSLQQKKKQLVSPVSLDNISTWQARVRALIVVQESTVLCTEQQQNPVASSVAVGRSNQSPEEIRVSHAAVGSLQRKKARQPAKVVPKDNLLTILGA